jgi:hypothetical protein
MLRYMERSSIHFLKQKGWTNVQIAEFTGVWDVPEMVSCFRTKEAR